MQDVPEALAERLEAGQLAMHDARMPHASPPNRSDRWRRVVTLSYVRADAELASNTYRDFETNEPFDRQFFLVRGEAPPGRAFPRAFFRRIARRFQPGRSYAPAAAP